MIPFNLERALAGDKVITRLGSEITQLVSIETASQLMLYGYDVKFDTIETWFSDGSWNGNGKLTAADLFMAPKALRGFVNVYHNSVESGYSTRYDADCFALKDRIACINLSQFEEGEGL